MASNNSIIGGSDLQIRLINSRIAMLRDERTNLQNNETFTFDEIIEGCAEIGAQIESLYAQLDAIEG
jgi:hypothetical protein